jgi:hypothetical protein
MLERRTPGFVESLAGSAHLVTLPDSSGPAAGGLFWTPPMRDSQLTVHLGQGPRKI